MKNIYNSPAKFISEKNEKKRGYFTEKGMSLLSSNETKTINSNENKENSLKKSENKRITFKDSIDVGLADFRNPRYNKLTQSEPKTRTLKGILKKGTIKKLDSDTNIDENYNKYFGEKIGKRNVNLESEHLKFWDLSKLESPEMENKAIEKQEPIIPNIKNNDPFAFSLEKKEINKNEISIQNEKNQITQPKKPEFSFSKSMQKQKTFNCAKYIFSNEDLNSALIFENNCLFEYDFYFSRYSLWSLNNSQLLRYKCFSYSQAGKNTFIFSGGIDPIYGEISSNCFLANFENKEIDKTCDMITARFYHLMLFHKNSVICIGGKDKASGAVRDCEIWQQGKWSRLPNLNLKRYCGGVKGLIGCSSENGVYICGGAENDRKDNNYLSFEWYEIGFSRWSFVNIQMEEKYTQGLCFWAKNEEDKKDEILLFGENYKKKINLIEKECYDLNGLEDINNSQILVISGRKIKVFEPPEMNKCEEYCFKELIRKEINLFSF